MINLMYVVLMALLALNVSSEVLDGFSIVEESIKRTTENSSKQNESIYGTFESQMKANPDKVGAWFAKAMEVKQMSDSLYNLVETLKKSIVVEADGEEADISDIRNKEDLEAAAQVMLAPGVGMGGKLTRAVDSYRSRILKYVADPKQRTIIESNLSTKVPKKSAATGKSWPEHLFENMPVAAAVTLLSKLQSDVRYAEGEVLHTLVSNIDLKDIRVNRLSAFVIPESKTVISGDQFSAQIVMAAVDTTAQPEIYIGGRKVNGTGYKFTAGAVGEHSFGGYITMRNGSGEVLRRDFTQKYTVVAPSATVSADLMNVLYAGFDNPVSISVPGVPLAAVSASMAGGSFVSKGPGKFVARPAAVGKDVTITVSANTGGKQRQMGAFKFQVRKLPDPTPYIQIGTDRFRGEGLAKASIMGADGVKAAIDDGILDIAFRVTGFETVFFDNMGNAVPMASDGAMFSARQKDTFRKLARGKRFYITKVQVVGPDGIARTLTSPMQVIVK